ECLRLGKEVFRLPEPESHGMVTASCREILPVGTEGQVIHTLLVGYMYEKAISRYLSYPYFVVQISCSEVFPIRAEGYSRHHALMGDSFKSTARRDFPQSHGTIVTCSSEIPAIWAEC